MKKIFLILLIMGIILCLLVGCNVTTPGSNDNAEGEEEGEEETVTRVVMVELFTSHCPYCIIVEPILEEIAEEYERTEMILVEIGTWGGAITAGGNDRYIWYLPDIIQRTTPNTFFNGGHRIWKVATKYLFKSRIVAELAKDATISIEVSKTENSGNTTLSGSIKNISTSALNNLGINGMIFKDNGITGEKYMVSKIIKDTGEIGVTLAAGAEQSFEFVLEELSWAINMHGVIFVQDSSTKEILQAKYVE